MILATHQSLTYLPVKWFFRPFKFIYQTQDKNIRQQYADGIRVFDFRVSFKDGEPVIKHGLVEFKGDILDILGYLNQKNDSYVRLTLENGGCSEFPDFCKKCEENFRNIIFFGGTAKNDWKTELFKFREADVPPLVPCNQSRWEIGWWPWLYAKIHNKKNAIIHKGQNLMVDFYQI